MLMFRILVLRKTGQLLLFIDGATIVYCLHSNSGIISNYLFKYFLNKYSPNHLIKLSEAVSNPFFGVLDILQKNLSYIYIIHL